MKSPLLKIILCLLLAVGVFLRLWNLDKAPISLFGDEVDAGLQAYSMLSTGKDYMGHVHPIIFRSFAEHRLPMQLYMIVPFIKLFGLNEFGVRGASVFMGLLSVLGMYLLTKELFGKSISIIATFLLLFSPWHFVFSRQANDAGFLLPFTLFGVLFFIKGLRKYKYLMYSAVTFGLGIYSYATISLFAPLFIVILLVIYLKQIKEYAIPKLLLVGLLGFLVVTPYLYESIRGTTVKRVSVISLISREELEQKVVEGRLWAKGFWGKIFYNKYTIVGEELFKNYTQAFSPNFLFANGDSNPRHNISGFGQMYPFEIFTVLIGIYASLIAIKSKDRKYYIMFLFWFLIAPLPSSLTREGGNHAARLILMLPPLILFSAKGTDFVLSIKKPVVKIILTLFLLFLAIFNICKFMHRYFVIWPNESWRFWHCGFKETLTYVKSVDTEYQKIYFNNTYEPMLPRFLFYYKYDMTTFHQQFKGDIHIENLEEGFDGFSLGDKYYFGDLKKPIERLAKPGVLVVASGEKDITNPLIFENPNLKLLEVITSPYMDSIFYVFTGS